MGECPIPGEAAMGEVWVQKEGYWDPPLADIVIYFYSKREKNESKC